MKQFNFIDIYNNSLIIKIIVFSIVNVILLPFAIILLFLKLIFKIRFIRVVDLRIGHLTLNTELFLRRLKLNTFKKNSIYIGIASTKPCNNQLLEMYMRQVQTLQVPKFIYDNSIFRAFSSNKSLLGIFGIYRELPLNFNEYYEFNHTKPSLKFTKEEEKKGKQLLTKMGIDNWFICFHARDSKYLKGLTTKDTSYHDFRNCDIHNYLPAAEYITKRGGYAIRMGTFVEKSLEHNNPKIIDYATTYRDDFGDIYLPAKCKFFLGNTAGIYQVAAIFNVPTAIANNIPLNQVPLRKTDIFIPKKLWSLKKKRFLTFKEIMKYDINYEYNQQYVKAGIQPIENTPEEILDLIIEMNKRIDGTWKVTKEDEKLQRVYKSVFKSTTRCYNFPSRIGAKFLRENKEILE